MIKDKKQMYAIMANAELLLLKELLLHRSTQRPYLVPIVIRAGALLSDAHTETGQTAIFVLQAEVEGSRFTARARWAFNVHL